ncbi:MAG: response regulator transcription factor [Acidobacteriota bacterium]
MAYARGDSRSGGPVRARLASGAVPDAMAAANRPCDASRRNIVLAFGMRILLVEDERSAARMIAKGLREAGYAVDIANDGDVALEQAAAVAYDVIVLDVMLPRRNGLDVCSELRSGGSTVPILMLTARDAVDARIAGLDRGADDYVTKPFAFGELLARVRALGRRRTLPLLPDCVDIGPLHLNTRTRELSIEGRVVVLTAREYALLEFLSRKEGAVVSREEIAEHVWDDRYDPLSNVIDVYVQRLRRKIDHGGSSWIRTRRGSGYQLVVSR